MLTVDLREVNIVFAVRVRSVFLIRDFVFILAGKRDV